jgi:hypothetical protein
MLSKEGDKDVVVVVCVHCEEVAHNEITNGCTTRSALLN